MKCLFRRETFDQDAWWKGWVEQKTAQSKIYCQNLTAYEGRDIGGAEEELWVCFLPLSVLCVIAVRALWLQEAFALSAPWDSADKWNNQEVVWDWALSVPVTMIESHFAVAPNCIFLSRSGRACVSQELFSGTFSSLCCCCCVKLAALQTSELPFSQVVCSLDFQQLFFSSSSP